MKRFLIVSTVLLALVLMFSVPDLKAQTTRNIWITVSCTGTLSIVVINSNIAGVTNWMVTNVPFGFQTNRVVASIISNDGTITSTLGLELTNYSVLWADGAAPGINQYALLGLFSTNNALQPAPATYLPADDVITTVLQNSDSTTVIFGFDAANNGEEVDPAKKRDLWLYLSVPTGGIQNPAQPTMRCIINASPF